jgi:hypothetical protein
MDNVIGTKKMLDLSMTNSLPILGYAKLVLQTHVWTRLLEQIKY